MKEFFQLVKDTWSFIKYSKFGVFMRDAYINGKEFFSGIWVWVDFIFQYSLYLIPMWATVHYLGWGYLILTIIYLLFGTFFAMFNDTGPYWLSYVLLWFWLPAIIISSSVSILVTIINIFIIEPGKWILRKVGIMKPKYTRAEIKASKYFAKRGMEIIEKNKNKNKNNN